MGRLRIEREHSLGWLGARELAQTWLQAGELRWQLRCQRWLSDDQERIDFEGPGLKGQLWVLPQRFELDLELGFLLNAYRSRIETELQRQLDAALGTGPSNGPS